MDIICLFHKLLDNIHEKTRGGIAAWDCSASRVLTLNTIDHLTTNMDFSADILARAMYYFQNKTFVEEEAEEDPVLIELNEDIGFALYFNGNTNSLDNTTGILLAFDNSTAQWGTVRVTKLKD